MGILNHKKGKLRILLQQSVCIQKNTSTLGLKMASQEKNYPLYEFSPLLGILLCVKNADKNQWLDIF